MDGKGGVVRLNDSVGNLGRGHNGESGHHTVRELFADLGDQQGTHTGTGTTTERVGDLEALEAVATLGLTTDNVKNLVNKLSTLSVVTLGPVVASTGLSKDEVVGTEKLTEGTSTDGIHGTGLEIDKNGTRNILVAGRLQLEKKKSLLAKPNSGELALPANKTIAYLVEVDVNALKLELGGAVVAIGWLA